MLLCVLDALELLMLFRYSSKSDNACINIASVGRMNLW